MYDPELRELAMEYHRRTEQFDQITCDHKNEHGIAIPHTPAQMKLCSQNARDVMKDILIRTGVDPKTFRKAMKFHRNEFEDRWLEGDDGR